MSRKHFKQIAFLFLLATAFCSCAQQKTVVKRLYSFSMEKLPGTVMKNENGDPVPVKPVTVLLVYAETKANSVSWDTAWFENKAWKLVSTLSANGLFEIGYHKQGDEKIVIKADSSQFLYQLYLQPIEGVFPMPQEYEQGKILLKGRFNSKVFYRKAEFPQEIRAFEAM